MKPINLLYPLLFTAFFTVTASGQSVWAPLGAKWHYCQGTGIGAPPCGGFYYLESKSDTVVDGQLCRKLSGYQKDWRNQVTPLPDRFTFAQNDSVFTYQPGRNRFLLTYDFTAQTGDTLEFPAPELFSWDPADSTFRVVVDSIIARPAGQDTMRFFYVTSLPDENWVFYSGWYAEKIGGRMLHTPFPATTIPEIDGFIRCYTDATAFIQFGSDPCDYTLSGWFGKDAMWTYGTFAILSAGYETIETDGDTVIQGITCRIFRRTHKWIDLLGPGAGIRTTVGKPRYAYDVADRVYVWGDSSFILIYDFNLKPGDLLLTPVKDCPMAYGYRIDSVGTMVVDGETLRFQRVTTLPYNGADPREVTILERIGMAFGPGPFVDTLPAGYFFLDEAVSCFTDFPDRPFRCYSDADIDLYKIGPLPCDFIINAGEASDPLTLKIYPNPAEDWLTVYLEKPPGGARYAISDALGRVLIAGYLTQQENRALVAWLPSGIYTLTVSAKDANIVRKIVKK